MKILRIFVAFPSDVATERNKVEWAASALRRLADWLGLKLDVVDWHQVVPEPGRPEAVILDQLNPTSWDLFIGILWQRFGTPTGARDPETGQDYMSGTEEEFRSAYRLWQKYQRPRIMVYRCLRAMSPLADPEQLKRVQDFFAEFDATGAHPGLYTPFDTTESFGRLLLDHFIKHLLEYGDTIPGRSISLEDARTLIPTTDNLPRRLQFFGRENELHRILQALSPEDRSWGAVLYGLGGIGKTSLAIEAAYLSKERKLFDFFVFVSAKDNTLDPPGIRELPPMARTRDEFVNETIHVLRQTGIAQLSGDEKSRALLDVLRERRILLIYDNLDTLTKEDQEALAEFLRKLPQGCKALVTTRRRFGNGAAWERLERLEWSASLEIIKSEISRDQALEKKMLQVEPDRWQELDGLTKGSPLALVHILGLLRTRTTLTFEGVLELLRTSTDPDLQTFIFKEARRDLNNNDEVALCALSFFELSATLEGWMYVSQLSNEELTASISRLDDLSLLDITLEQGTFALHALTRNFVRDELLKDSQMAAEFESRIQRYFNDQKSEEVSSSLPPTLQPLEQLAANYWWSWSNDGPGLFRDLDPETWEQSDQNPRLLLTKISEYRRLQMATDPAYARRLQRISDAFNSYLRPKKDVPWDPITPEHPVAYFCAEFGVHTSLPLYSGGLGILAGDHLKSASDQRLPLVAVGLLYRFGYFHQRLSRDGWQEEYYSETHPPDLPVKRVYETDGSPLVITVDIRNRPVKAIVWCALVGRVSLYLLDTNIEENDEIDRWVTGHLYGGDRETRLVQEMLLGIGGIRLLRKLKIEPHVFHLNEGHSALLTLELARELIQSQNIDFDTAARNVRERCVFTTHTAVAGGGDNFNIELLKKCFGSYAEGLGLTETEFHNLGLDPGSSPDTFGLTPLALRMCRSTNGVSREHGEISRSLWQALWPERAVEDVPITQITNGIHPCTWVAPPIRAVYEKRIGHDWFEKTRDPEKWSREVQKISDEELWRANTLLKQRLIGFIRHTSHTKRLASGESMDHVEAARTMFDPEALTIGFARRVHVYKRWSLLTSDPSRLLKLLTNEDRPVQFIFAGKAHPQDESAKQILQQLVQWEYNSQVRNRIVFLRDFDQEIARQLVQSVDVWLTTSRRPLEPSSTSGQKVAVNGGLNLGVLGGWWLEGYDGANGFAIGNRAEATEVPEIDQLDAESLFRVLEQEVIPLYYHRDKDGLPREWIAMMKRSIETLVPSFNSDRMVAEYAKRIYARDV